MINFFFENILMNKLNKMLIRAMLGAAVLAPGMVKAQLWTPGMVVHNSTSSNVIVGPSDVATQHKLYLENTSGNQPILRTHVSGVNDFFDVVNGTLNSGKYYPVLFGYQASASWTPTMDFLGACNTASDVAYSGTLNPIMQFECRTYTVDPSATSLPSGTAAAIGTRPLFDWKNWSTVCMRMSHDGNLGIGTAANSLSARLTVQGADASESTDGFVLNDNTGNRLLEVTNAGNLYLATTSATGAGAFSGYGLDSYTMGPGPSNYGAHCVARDATCATTGGYFNGFDNTGGSSKTVYGVDAEASTTNICGSLIYGIYASAYSGSTGCGASTNHVLAGYFVGDVVGTGTGTFLGSDAKLKTNVMPLQNALDQIGKLNPKTYDYKTSEFPSMHLPEGNHIGLIAQEVETVFPALVKATAQPEIRDKAGKIVTPRVEFKAVNYTGLVPVLVKGVQEEEQQIQDLKQQVADLTAAIAKLTAQTSPATPAIGTAATQTAVLYQNVPNPTNSSTIIRYFVPTTAKQAQIVVTDLERRTEMQRVTLQTGNGQIEIKASALPSGIYLYSLVVDGTNVDSKKMVVTP